MKILVFGADGFIGKTVLALALKKYDTYGAARSPGKESNFRQANLLDRDSVINVLKEIRPEVIINCAGIVDNSDASLQNITFTTNILEAVNRLKLPVTRIVISGSAAEYGQVDPKNIPVHEDAPLNASAGYGLSKLKEEELALQYSKQYQLPIAVARIFNPIGVGMHPRFLIPKIISQVADVKEGRASKIVVSRLDSSRDYINVQDVADALLLLAIKGPQQTIYNIGSGIATSNGKLIDLVLDGSELDVKPEIVETSAEPEAQIASQADITRIRTEFRWTPHYSIEETVRAIIDGTKE